MRERARIVSFRLRFDSADAGACRSQTRAQSLLALNLRLIYSLSVRTRARVCEYSRRRRYRSKLLPRYASSPPHFAPKLCERVYTCKTRAALNRSRRVCGVVNCLSARAHISRSRCGRRHVVACCESSQCFLSPLSLLRFSTRLTPVRCASI